MYKYDISVIITTYKRSDSLERAIKSVLKQNGKFEVIVVDDNDQESEYRKINELKLKKFAKLNNFVYLKHKKNLNGANARNTGINKSRGKYITFLDDDDEFLKDRLEKIIKKLEEGYDFVCTGYSYKKNNVLINEFYPKINGISIPELQFQILCQNSFFGTGSNIVCKTNFVKKINGFDPNFIRNQDMEFMIRYLSTCKNVASIDEVLVTKNIDSTLNIPSFKKFYQVKNLFFQKFSKIIESLDEKSQKEIYKKNINELLIIACYYGNFKDIKNALNLEKKYKTFSIIFFLKVFIKSQLKKIIRKGDKND